MVYAAERHEEAVHFWENDVRVQLTKLRSVWLALCMTPDDFSDFVGATHGEDILEGLAAIINEAVKKLYDFAGILLADGGQGEKAAEGQEESLSEKPRNGEAPCQGTRGELTQTPA